MQDVSFYSSFCLFVLTVKLEILLGGSSTVLEIERHLELGRELTAKGQFVDALTHLHAAVEGDPNNYLTYYRRAMVFLALGRSKSALPDLEAVIKLKPDFTAAWMQRGNILLKQGRLDEAHINFEAVLRHDPQNQEAIQQYQIIEPIKKDVESAFFFIEDEDYVNAIAALSRALEACPWDAHLRETRADCYIKVGDPVQATYDLRSITKLLSDSTDAHYRLSGLHYILGDAEESLGEIRACLKLDPDHKACFAHYKKVKKLASHLKTAQEHLNSEQYEECIEKAMAIMKVEKDVDAYKVSASTFLCQCQAKAGQPMEAISSCTDALQIEESPQLYCYRAEAHITNEDYNEALNDYKRAQQLDENSHCAQKGIPHVQKLQKQSQKRDYYKILGVKRTASKTEIVKAYRKLAQKWHPDGYNGEEKKMAEKKFIDIAAAKEVLTDPEKRAKFDNGEDPLDPESQAGQGFNPFAQGFSPFREGSPFQFRFHFT